MFHVIENVEDFSNNLEDGSFVLATIENKMNVVQNGVLVDCEEVYGNFEEVAYSVINEDFFSQEEAIVFEEAPFYQEGKYGQVYYINFTANKVKSLDENPGTFTMVNLSNETVMFTNFTESNLVNFKLFVIMDETTDGVFNKDTNQWEIPQDQSEDNFFTIAYNVKIENTLIEGPIKISIHRLGNI
jgi:hypothetical protein